MDVAPWCYKWDGWDGSPDWVRYRAPHGAYKFREVKVGCEKFLR